MICTIGPWTRPARGAVQGGGADIAEAACACGNGRETGNGNGWRKTGNGRRETRNEKRETAGEKRETGKVHYWATVFCKPLNNTFH